jgi:hypothetical protein
MQRPRSAGAQADISSCARGAQFAVTGVLMRKTWTIGLVLLSCGDEGSGGSPSDRYPQKLRECGILSQEGKYSSLPQVEELEPIEVCILNCALDASCADLETGWCTGAVPARVAACLERCAPTFQCEDGSSDDAYRCDGYEDCDDASDEEGCSSDLYFVCADGERFPKDYVCDGEHDCSDDSDEMNCPARALFMCKNGQTVIEEFECDGELDCTDGSDEEGCLARGLVFECASGETVSKEAVCDLIPDCEDGSDEEQDCAELICDS